MQHTLMPISGDLKIDINKNLRVMILNKKDVFQIILIAYF
jgi:hypothetical protein